MTPIAVAIEATAPTYVTISVSIPECDRESGGPTQLTFWATGGGRASELSRRGMPELSLLLFAGWRGILAEINSIVVPYDSVPRALELRDNRVNL